MLSKRASKVKPSATLSLSSRAKAMVKAGKDVIAFGAGQPDFPTPENVKKAAIKAINDNFTGYTAVSGIPELKQAIVDKLKRDNGLSYDVSQVIVSNGGKHSLTNIFLAMLDNGDEVILAAPYWVSYVEQIRLADGKPVIVETKSSDNFNLTAEMIAGKITDKTKIILINSPSNPTGAVISKVELKKIADLAVVNNLYVVSDEVYEPFVYDGKKHYSIASFGKAIRDLTIIVNAVSKTYSMTGWRIGYCAGPASLVTAMSNIQSHMTSNPCSISQKAAVEAINGPQEQVAAMVKEFDKRRKYMFERVSAIEGVSCIMPQGAFYLFADVSGVLKKSGVKSSMELCERLLDEALVAAVPGGAFGADTCLRFSYALSMDEIKKGLDRFEKWISEL